MKKVIVILFVLASISSCSKEEEPEVQDIIVLDQATVEEHVTGNWNGVITGPNGVTENMEVTVEEAVLGEQAGTGRYFAPGFACGFEWTYERFSNGRIVFREKTLAPDVCYDNLEIFVRFEEEDFNTLKVLIPVPNGSFAGDLTRQ